MVNQQATARSLQIGRVGFDDNGRMPLPQKTIRRTQRFPLPSLDVNLDEVGHKAIPVRPLVEPEVEPYGRLNGLNQRREIGIQREGFPHPGNAARVTLECGHTSACAFRDDKRVVAVLRAYIER